MHIRRTAAFGVVLLTLSSWTCLAFAQAPSQPWTNNRLLPDERADLVVKQMTLDEKIQLVHGSMAMLGRKIPGALGGDGFVPGIPRLGIPDLNLIGAGVGVTNLGKRPKGSYRRSAPIGKVGGQNLDGEIVSIKIGGTFSHPSYGLDLGP